MQPPIHSRCSILGFLIELRTPILERCLSLQFTNYGSQAANSDPKKQIRWLSNQYCHRSYGVNGDQVNKKKNIWRQNFIYSFIIPPIRRYYINKINGLISTFQHPYNHFLSNKNIHTYCTTNLHSLSISSLQAYNIAPCLDV